MYNQKQIIEIYNQVSEDELTKEKLSPIIAKFYLIMNKIKMDDIELIRVIDTLIEINYLGKIDKITPEIIDLIIRTTKSEKINLEGTLYFSIILKHVLLPFKENICKQEYDKVLFLSEFELFIDLANTMLNKKDLIILEKYNQELKEILLKYKEARRIYNKCVVKKCFATEVLSTMILHFVSFLYFKLDEYEYDYGLTNELLIKTMENFEDFMNYYYSEVWNNNETISPIEKEYILANDMVQFIYNNKKEEKKKRK